MRCTQFCRRASAVWGRCTQFWSLLGTLHAFLEPWARCTQFCPTVHAGEAWCTQFFVSPRMMVASSTCAFDASRSFRGLRNCVHRPPLACSVVRNCVHRTPLACSVVRNCVHRTPLACSVVQNCVHRTPVACSVAAKLRVPYPSCVKRAPEACVGARWPPHSLPCLSRPQPTLPPRASRTPTALPACQ